MFLPQARCRTVVPDSFKVLLSQRRRWINSTIHNLMELVLVQNLCGTFCFSMQFVVFMDLLGTVVLPIAIMLTYSLIIGMIMNPPHNFEEAIPLTMLVAVIGLPGVLILITSRKVVYIAWMLIYLLALPIWNFVLPVYAFWHFDDFSWGETRKVEGEAKGAAHGDGGGVFDGTSVPMRRWEDWERSRLRKIKREERRRKELERMERTFHNPRAALGVHSEVSSQYDGSDTHSVASSEEDSWGPQIGGYNEHDHAYPPPPAGVLLPRNEILQSAETLNSSELEAMLEKGWGASDQNLSSQNLMQSSMSSTSSMTRYQLSDGPGRQGGHPPVPPGNQYSPLRGNGMGVMPEVMTPVSPNGMSSALGTNQTHARKRSGGGARAGPPYGPLGPLDPANRI